MPSHRGRSHPLLAKLIERQAATWSNQGSGNHRELADLASFLLSDHTGYINGEVITIDGGEWLKGAGQFNFLDRLTPEDWEIMRVKKGR